jgi:hypothetical protein
MTNKTYRVDWAEGQDGTPVVIYDLTREQAIQKARSLSRNNQDQTCYAIARDDFRGEDLGQRVYVNGRFSHQDDEF